MTTKFQQLKELVKQIAVLQRTIKNHRKTVNFKGEKRETIELYVYEQVFNQKTRKWDWTNKKAKIYLTPYNAQMLLGQGYGWTPNDVYTNAWDTKDCVKSDKVSISRMNIIDVYDDTRKEYISYGSTDTMARVFNEAYALLKYERKTKKNEELEKLRKEVDENPNCYVKQLMDYFRDEEQEEK